MIDIQGMCKTFGAHQVLHDVDVSVAAGHVTAIVGPNGAGKTTLIKSILGLTRSDVGVIRIDGVTVGDDPAYRARIGYMPQIARFPENLSGAELLAMLKDLRGGEPAGGYDEELVARFELGGQLAKPLRVLSGGTRQKVNAVMAFLFRPDLLILDEPTAGLDPVASGVLKDKIAAEAAAGRTFVLTSHVMAELDELCDDVVCLLEGSVRYSGPVRDLKLRTRQLSLERAIAQIMREEAA